jgi:hypothetical protein
MWRALAANQAANLDGSNIKWPREADTNRLDPFSVGSKAHINRMTKKRQR